MKCEYRGLCYCLKGKLSSEGLENLTSYVRVNIAILVVSLF